MKSWSNLANIVYRRTYARRDSGVLENWEDTVDRVVEGNIKGHNVPESEVKDLIRLMKERKAIPAGRGLWFSGSPSHAKLGGAALNNCWYLNTLDWQNFIVAQDLLMLGGGVGLSVEHRFTSKLPKIKSDVKIEHKATRDADFIIPDSREGWCELTRRALESFFVTGRSFTYSTVCLRGSGELIKGFGGTASGPLPLIKFIENLCRILNHRQNHHVRPIDAADILTAIGEMVVSGNVRRSAIIILGDPWDKEYLVAKRWDLGPLPSYRSCANYSVVVDDIDDLHPLYWKTFQAGEAFGIVNRTSIQKYGRMGELKKDTAQGVNPCAEATLEPFEPCNLQEIALPNIKDEEEFILAARLMHRYGKRVTLENYHHDCVNDVVQKNRRVGTSITGCLSSPLFKPDILDRAYEAIQQENKTYSKKLNISESIRTTVIKPSGTVSKVLDMNGYEGIHAPIGRYMIQRIRFAAEDSLIPLLKEAGHYMEPVKNLDGGINPRTLVVDFYVEAPKGSIVENEGFGTEQQLDTLLLAQKHWADQAVSTTVYYDRKNVNQIKEWLENNIKNVKSISFMARNDHGFVQAPKEAISKEQFEKLSKNIKPIDTNRIEDGSLESQECANGVCPVK